MPNLSTPMTQLWHRVEASLAHGCELELVGGRETPYDDPRVVDFSRQSGEYLVQALTTAYPVLQDDAVLPEFIHTFAAPRVPTDEEVLSFYARFGPLGDTEWQDQFLPEDRRLLPQATHLGLREPVWYARQLATELDVICRLYWGLADRQVEVLPAILGPAPTTGQLVNVLLLSGTVHKFWASPDDLARRVGSIGQFAPSPSDPGRDFTPEECFGYGRSLLAGAINQKEAKAYRQWTAQREVPAPPETRRRSKRPKPRPENPILGGTRAVLFPSLIVALHLKLSDAIAEGRLLRPCEGCGRYFHPDRPDQLYCKVRCSNAYRRREFSRRQRERSESQETPDAR